MKAMILAAGLGQRMRPLTDHTPKPLLRVKDKPLLQYHLEALAEAGLRDVIINLAYLGEQIRDFVGSGQRFGLRVTYSSEPEPLETGGAIAHALPLLGEAPFLLINADVWCDYPLTKLAGTPLATGCLGRLLLVPNPDFHPGGDFTLTENGTLTEGPPQTPQQQRLTFAGISLLRPALVADYPRRRRRFPLLEAFQAAISQQRLQGELYSGVWSDVGTPQRLQMLNEPLPPHS